MQSTKPSHTPRAPGSAGAPATHPWRRSAGAIAFALWSAAATAAPILTDYLNADWTDADKLHDFGNWGTNYWDDRNGNGNWDISEPLGDRLEAGWKSATDLSCWIASAANMLASAGFANGNAQNIYWDLVYNMALPWQPVGWQFGGWQHEALNWYLANRPHPLGGIYEVKYYGVYNKEDGTSAEGWPTNPFDFAANLLGSGYEVGIVVHGSIYHALTFEGYNDQTGKILLADSDASEGALDTYGYARLGATNWKLSDYVANGIAVDYFATLRYIPAPGTLPLSALGLVAIGLLGRRRRQPETAAPPAGTAGR